MSEITSTMQKAFAKGLATGVGKALGGNIVNGIFAAIGLSDNQSQLEGQMKKMSEQLEAITNLLGNITTELDEIEQNQETQIVLTASKAWQNKLVNKNFTSIDTTWDLAIDGTMCEDDLKALVLDHDNSIMSHFYAIQHAVSSIDGGLLSIYAELLGFQIQFQFPASKPWIPTSRFYNYCDYVLQSYWKATTLAKTAFLATGSSKEAENCSKAYMKAVKEFEGHAFSGMIRVLESVNAKMHSMADAYPRLYDPYFAYQNFNINSNFDPSTGSTVPSWNDTLTDALKRKMVYNAELERSIMGKEIESMNDLFSRYRPVSNADQERGRINICVGYWREFYREHQPKEMLNDIRLLDRLGNKIEANEIQEVEFSLQSNQYDYYRDPKLSYPPVVQTHYNFGKFEVTYLRLTYFVPYGDYLVDEGGRRRFEYEHGTYGFHGDSANFAQFTPVNEVQSDLFIQWAPWNGAFLLANNKLS